MAINYIEIISKKDMDIIKRQARKTVKKLKQIHSEIDKLSSIIGQSVAQIQ